MKLDAKTVSILKSFSAINPSLLFKEGNVIRTMAPNKTILARANVPDNFDRRCAIYELSKFLGGLSLAESPDVTFTDNSVVIKDEKSGATSSISYAAETAIKAPPEKNLALPSIDVSINITSKDLKNIIHAASVYSLPSVAIVGDGSKVSFVALNVKDPQSITYSIDVGTTDKTFKVIFMVENLVKMFPEDYLLEISSSRLSRFVSNDFEYFISVEAGSTFG
jgi:hypothetical protein